MSKPKIALRVRPLKKWADVAAATQHGQRIRNVEHVDLTKSHLNTHWEHNARAGGLVRSDAPADITRCLRTRAGQLGARWHKTAIVGTEIMFIASSEFFQTNDGICDHARAQSWAEACLDAWEGLFPGQSVAARLDLDETTPHLSIFFLPLHERHYRSTARALKEPTATKLKVSHNKTFGEAKGPEILSMLQNWIADEMQIAGSLLPAKEEGALCPFGLRIGRSSIGQGPQPWPRAQHRAGRSTPATLARPGTAT